MDTLVPFVIGLRVLRAVGATKRIRGVLQGLQTQFLCMCQSLAVRGQMLIIVVPLLR